MYGGGLRNLKARTPATQKKQLRNFVSGVIIIFTSERHGRHFEIKFAHHPNVSPNFVCDSLKQILYKVYTITSE